MVKYKRTVVVYSQNECQNYKQFYFYESSI